MNQRQTAIDIFLAGVESVKPDNLIRSFVSIRANKLLIEKLKLNLAEIKNIYVVGAGKASALMAKELESILEALMVYVKSAVLRSEQGFSCRRGL